MPRFLMTYRGKDTTPPSPEKLAALQEFTARKVKGGKVVDTGGMFTQGPNITLEGGTFTITDGPFPETKELIVGYAIVDVADLAEAIAEAREFMSVAGDGTGEIRQMMNAPLDHPH
jgi:hypothetical protein